MVIRKHILRLQNCVSGKSLCYLEEKESEFSIHSYKDMTGDLRRHFGHLNAAK